jgi:hypothetical protein
MSWPGLIQIEKPGPFLVSGTLAAPCNCYLWRGELLPFTIKRRQTHWRNLLLEAFFAVECIYRSSPFWLRNRIMIFEESLEQLFRGGFDMGARLPHRAKLPKGPRYSYPYVTSACRKSLSLFWADFVELPQKMAATYNHPSAVSTALVSVTHFTLGSSAAKSRLSVLGAKRACRSLLVVGLRVRLTAALMPSSCINRATHLREVCTPRALRIA